LHFTEPIRLIQVRLTIAEAIFGAHEQNDLFDHTFDIYTSSEGSEGTKVSIHKSMLLSALVLKQGGDRAGDSSAALIDANIAADVEGTWTKALASNVDAGNPPSPTYDGQYITLAVKNTGQALDLSQVSSGVFETAIENVVFLRAQTGGGMTRLNFALDSIASQETNMRSALGRIEDVDIAMESANLARYSILMQASAAMAVQANVQNEVALMLLR